MNIRHEKAWTTYRLLPSRDISVKSSQDFESTLKDKYFIKDVKFIFEGNEMYLYYTISPSFDIPEVHKEITELLDKHNSDNDYNILHFCDEAKKDLLKVPDGNYTISYKNWSHSSDSFKIENGRFVDNDKALKDIYTLIRLSYYGDFIEGFKLIEENVLELYVGS